MKILQVLHGLSYGGVERLICDLAFCFKSRHHMAVACLDFEGDLKLVLESYDVPVYCFGRKPGIDLSVVKKIAALYQSEKFDVVHAHQYTPFFYAISGKLLSRHKPYLIFTEHGRHQPDHVSWKRVVFNRLVLSQVNCVTGVSEFSKKSLIKYEKIPEAKIQVVYNGISDEPVQLKADAEVLKKNLGVEDGVFVLCCVGRFHRVKGQEYLTRAMKEVAENEPRVKLLYVGDGPERQKNEALARHLGVSASITFAGSRDDVNEIIGISDILVLPSLSEACSLVLLEAMRLRKAIVATDAGGNPELLRPSDAGMIVPRADSHFLAQAILTLMRNNSRREELGQKAYEKWISSFTTQIMRDQYEKIYQRASF